MVSESRLNQPFEASGEEIIKTFQGNMRRMKEFLERCGMKE